MSSRTAARGYFRSELECQLQQLFRARRPPKTVSSAFVYAKLMHRLHKTAVKGRCIIEEHVSQEGAGVRRAEEDGRLRGQYQDDTKPTRNSSNSRPDSATESRQAGDTTSCAASNAQILNKNRTP